jgi:hypothetical protein
MFMEVTHSKRFTLYFSLSYSQFTKEMKRVAYSATRDTVRLYEPNCKFHKRAVVLSVLMILAVIILPSDEANEVCY